MIGRVTGDVVHIEQHLLILETAGIGYNIHCTTSQVSIAKVGSRLSLWIYEEVKESAIQLFGFSSLDERACFTRLRSVQGVGGKMALNMLSTYVPDELYHIIASGEHKMLEGVPGVGKKLASRIITELSSKAQKVTKNLSTFSKPHLNTTDNATQDGQAQHDRSKFADIVDALMSLGFSNEDAITAARAAIAAAPEDHLSALITQAISYLGKQ